MPLSLSYSYCALNNNLNDGGNEITMDHYFDSEADKEELLRMDQLFTRYSLSTSSSLSSFSTSQSPSKIPSWVVTPSDASYIHRFFDSSPFSPSGKYLGLVRIDDHYHLKQQFSNSMKLMESDKSIDVIIINLHTGERKSVFKSTAWGSQVGCHVQWGRTDNELLFNVGINDIQLFSLLNNASNIKHFHAQSNGKNRMKEDEVKQKGALGIVLNLFSTSSEKFTSTIKLLECPIYHVSNDGKYSVTPNIHKIKYTQLGYGSDENINRREMDNLYHHKEESNEISSKLDGVYLSDLSTGTCQRIISLYDLSLLAKLDVRVPTYGFHAKLSHDSEYVLFVMRTLHLDRNQKYKRKQHLFVMHRNGTFPIHLVTWSSSSLSKSSSHNNKEESHFPSMHSFFSDNSKKISKNKGVDKVIQFDGNHPTWFPSENKISMNLVISDVQKRTKRSFYEVYVFDISLLYQNYINQDGMNLQRNVVAQSLNRHSTFAWISKVFPYGSGHPLFHTDKDVLLMDAYTKESGLFCSERKEQVPLRLIHTKLGKEVWLMKVNVAAIQHEDSKKRNDPIERTMYNAWRCDVHPAWSRDHKWIALNERSGNGNRRVLIAYVGSNITAFF